jgi:nucleoside 2-deoxyribosyltransferase
MDDMRVYVAGPDGFTEPGRRWHETVLLPALASAGIEPLDPWVGNEALAAALALAPGPARLDALRAANHAVAHRNRELIDACDAVLAVLDGPDVDAGTAAEIGWAAAVGKPVVGLRTDLSPAGDNEACAVNLQVEYFVTLHGGRVVATVDEAVAALAAVRR